MDFFNVLMRSIGLILITWDTSRNNDTIVCSNYVEGSNFTWILNYYFMGVNLHENLQRLQRIEENSFYWLHIDKYLNLKKYPRLCPDQWVSEFWISVVEKLVPNAFSILHGKSTKNCDFAVIKMPFQFNKKYWHHITTHLKKKSVSWQSEL